MALASDSAIGGHKISTVVPATATTETTVHEMSNTDLAMKLHYLRAVYYFPGVTNLETSVLKMPLFRLLERYFPVSGRIRLTDTGRPFIKCNDSGVRIVEARCEMLLEEWLQKKDMSRHKHLVPDGTIGPNLHFSPLVLIQFTWFKGGGLAVGLSWSHALGDADSAVNFINMYGQMLGGNLHLPPETKSTQQLQSSSKFKENDGSLVKPPLSVKQVHVLDNCWLPVTKQKMETLSFHISETKLRDLRQNICTNNSINIQPFEALCALFWCYIAKIRDGKETKTVTIYRATANSSPQTSSAIGNLSNATISTVVADRQAEIDQLAELAKLIANGGGEDECMAIEQEVDDSGGSPDLILYGANLTFVDMEKIELYGLEVKGQKPVLVEYSIDGVGDEGAALVLKDGGEEDGGQGGGRMVSVVLPEEQLLRLRQELGRDWGIAA